MVKSRGGGRSQEDGYLVSGTGFVLRGSGLLQILFHCVDEILVDEEDEPKAGYLKEIAKSTVKINSNQIETNNFFITFNIQ